MIKFRFSIGSFVKVFTCVFQSRASDPDMRVSQTYTQTSLVQTPCSPDDGDLSHDMNNTLSKTATEVCM